MKATKYPIQRNSFTIEFEYIAKAKGTFFHVNWQRPDFKTLTLLIQNHGANANILLIRMVMSPLPHFF